MKNNRITKLVYFFICIFFIFEVGVVRAEIVEVSPSVTAIESTATRMISYRHQEHMWQTDDGTTHFVVNQGEFGAQNASLTLFSSFGDGETWNAMHSFFNTNEQSTSDGILVDDELSLVYSTNTGKIKSIRLQYNNTSQAWDTVQIDIVFDSTSLSGLNPTIANDTHGRSWCTFISRSNVLQKSYLRIFQKPDSNTDWQDTGLILGMAESFLTSEMSACPVAMPNGIGVVYTTQNEIKWAYRENNWPVEQEWDEELLFIHQPPYANDPYGSHFSVATDETGNIHVATIEKGKLLYLRYDSQTDTWETARSLTPNLRIAYMQTTVSGDNLLIFFNVLSNVGVLQSHDQGDTFFFSHLLNHPPRLLTGATYSIPRIETPERVFGEYIPTVQQYIDNNDVQRLMYFSVTP